MDPASFLGVLLGVACLAISIATARGASWGAFFDGSALLMVGGGTLACVLISLPLQTVLSSLWACRQVFFHQQPDFARLIRQIMGLAETARRRGLLALDEHTREISDPFLVLAIQMAVDGTRPELLEEVLRTKMDAAVARHKMGRLLPEQMGRFAPAFGLIGTLVGLILMLSDLSHPAAIGPGMALAMITTLYGVLAANLFFLPFAEKLGHLGRHELLAMEIVVRGVLGIQAGENPRVISQKLSTLLPLGQRSKRPGTSPTTCHDGRPPKPMRHLPELAEPTAGVPAWVLPYGDMMTLLLACFVMLTSVSEIKDDRKFQALADSLRGQAGSDVAIGGGTLPTALAENSSLASLPGGSRAAATVLTFEEGKSTLTAENTALLARAVEGLVERHQPIEIRGYAPAGLVSPDSTWKNHWNLAYVRCTAAMQCLMTLGIPPQQIHLSVVAESARFAQDQDHPVRKESGSVEVFGLPEPTGEPEEQPNLGAADAAAGQVDAWGAASLPEAGPALASRPEHPEPSQERR
jgi:chemotaxis protein MotA